MEASLHTPPKKRKRWKKVVGWTVVGIVVFLLTVIIGLYMYITRSHPMIEGEITLKGLKEQVEVVRDEQGVPHIRANNEDDLYQVMSLISGIIISWNHGLRVRIMKQKLKHMMERN